MIDYIRENLGHKPEAETVRLWMENPYYNRDYLDKMLDYFERKIPLVKIGIEEFSPTDLFALEILKDSSNFTEENYKYWLKKKEVNTQPLQ